MSKLMELFIKETQRSGTQYTYVYPSATNIKSTTKFATSALGHLQRYNFENGQKIDIVEIESNKKSLSLLAGPLRSEAKTETELQGTSKYSH